MPFTPFLCVIPRFLQLSVMEEYSPISGGHCGVRKLFKKFYSLHLSAVIDSLSGNQGPEIVYPPRLVYITGV